MPKWCTYVLTIFIAPQVVSTYPAIVLLTSTFIYIATKYRKIYDQGVEPKVFINDFLELLYYIKNINSLTLESTNFSLNDEEFSKIKSISNKVESDVLVLFWQFAISSLEELDIVSNQHLSGNVKFLGGAYLSQSCYWEGSL